DRHALPRDRARDGLAEQDGVEEGGTENASFGTPGFGAVESIGATGGRVARGLRMRPRLEIRDLARADLVPGPKLLRQPVGLLAGERDVAARHGFRKSKLGCPEDREDDQCAEDERPRRTRPVCVAELVAGCLSGSEESG